MMTCRNALMNLMTREYSGYPNWHWLIMSICNCSYNQLCTVQVVCSTNTHSSSADTSWQLHNGCQTVNFTNIYQDTLSEFTRMIISDLAVYFIVAFWLWADKILYNIGVSTILCVPIVQGVPEKVRQYYSYKYYSSRLLPN